jgi:hypothetical protein
MPVKRTQIRGIKNAKKSNKFAKGGPTKRKLSAPKTTVNLEREQMKDIEKRYKDAEYKGSMKQHAKNLENHIDTFSEEGIRSVNLAGTKAGYNAVKDDYYNGPTSFYRARAGRIPMKTDDGKLRSIPGFLNTDLDGNYTRGFKKGGKLKSAGKKFKCGGKLSRKKKC